MLMRKGLVIGLIILIIISGVLLLAPQKSGLFGLHFAGSSVTRGFSSPITTNTESSVTLTVVLSSSDTIYGIDEVYPSGFTVTNAGGGDTSQAGHLKWLETSAVAGSTRTYTYTIRAPATIPTSPTRYTFSGTYQFESETTTSNIGGPNFLDVTNPNPCAGQADGTSAGAGYYCCAQTKVTAPTCLTCQYAGCSGSNAACLNSSSSTTCGTTTCPASSCSGTGNNILSIYANTCNNMCSGTGSCITCVCSPTTTNCGTNKYCSVTPSPSCVSCQTFKANCNGLSSDLCEVDLNTNAQNCGACGNTCSAGLGCSNGACVNAVCAQYPQSTYPRPNLTTLNTEINSWKTNTIYNTKIYSLSDIILEVKLWKYCYGTGT